ncbi:hypothetical protein CDAR_272441 [Caerostris darwini]|uniref:Uncharacterized protein n=1 Tax=Caerostris darwini TaxID=1538125 RepID=A0AAV4V175_9ARAC|nr:hypothetical protein CDAR_272441 [Caerostris darwini]
MTSNSKPKFCADSVDCFVLCTGNLGIKTGNVFKKTKSVISKSQLSPLYRTLPNRTTCSCCWGWWRC